MSSKLRAVIPLLLSCALFALPVTAQSPEPNNPTQAPGQGPLQGLTKPPGAGPSRLSTDQAKRKGTIKVDVDLVLVNVTVTDPFNRLVTGLEQENFRVFEDSSEQEVVHFSSEDVPIS
ncbi:MAG: hypothetical protein DMG28_02595, partial [Acidobacteria bacterium]